MVFKKNKLDLKGKILKTVKTDEFNRTELFYEIEKEMFFFSQMVGKANLWKNHLSHLHIGKF